MSLKIGIWGTQPDMKAPTLCPKEYLFTLPYPCPLRIGGPSNGQACPDYDSHSLSRSLPNRRRATSKTLSARIYSKKPLTSPFHS